MMVVVNGESREVAAGASVATLVAELGLGNRACAVEVNKRVVPKPEHEGEQLKEGDRVEVVTLVGGG
jgi:thiamine biosynthesis protein ThiS